MIVTPTARPSSPKPVALLVPGWRTLRAITEHGERTAKGPTRVAELLTGLSGHVCYVEGSLRPMLATTGAKGWAAEVWRGRATRITLAGTDTSVTTLRRTLEGAGSPSDQFNALLEVVRLCESKGVRAASLSSMAWSLWRTTLSSPLELSSPPMIARGALFGGRQESTRPQVAHDQAMLDMTSAYPFSMVSRPYGGVMRVASKATAIDPEVAGIAEAVVTVPDELRFPPLPTRVAPEMISWRWGRFEGAWPFAELAAARALGCAVEVSRVLVPVTEVDPFGPWWELLRTMRASVSPAALKLTKIFSTLLWGLFGMTGDDTARVVWSDDLGERPLVVPRPPKAMPHARAVHVAAETAARVRVRLLLEGLYGDISAPIHVDTDGMIVAASSLSRRTLGEGPGEWRAKQLMSVVDLRAPQLYRYECGQPKCGWHYVASGVPQSLAADVFSRRHPGYQISLDGLDRVIPGGVEMDGEQVKRWTVAANALERAVFGRRLVNA